MQKSRMKKMTVRAFGLFLAFSMLGIPGALAEKDDAVTIPDTNLMDALVDAGADANGNGELTGRELEALTGELDLSGKSVCDLAGLELLKNVASLNLSGNSITDISVLSALSGLTALDLSGNDIEDITGLAGLNGLTALNLSGNEISDISALYDVEAPPEVLTLKSLDVSENYLNVVDGSADRAVTDALIWRGCFVLFDPQKKIPVKGVALNMEKLGMCPGDTATLNAAVIPDDAAVTGVVWQSNNDAVAMVQDGVVTAVSLGTASISAMTDDGGYTSACVVNVEPNTLVSSNYTIDDMSVCGVEPGTSLDTFKSHFGNDSASLFIYNSDGGEYNSPAVATGMTVKLVVGGIERDSRRIVVTGDATGDGMMTITDYTQLCLELVGSKPMDNLYASAGDYTQDGQLTIGDYVQMRLYIMGSDGTDGSDRILPDLPEVSDSRIKSFLDLAVEQLGKPYIWGAEGPDSFDCSGFVYYCLKNSGYDLGRWTADMYSHNKKWAYVDKDELQPGDLMFYYSDESDDGDHIGHIGIYLGNGYHIHASSDYGCIIICGVQGWYKSSLAYGRRVFD